MLKHQTTEILKKVLYFFNMLTTTKNTGVHEKTTMNQSSSQVTCPEAEVNIIY